MKNVIQTNVSVSQKITNDKFNDTYKKLARINLFPISVMDYNIQGINNKITRIVIIFGKY